MRFLLCIILMMGITAPAVFGQQFARRPAYTADRSAAKTTGKIPAKEKGGGILVCYSGGFMGAGMHFGGGKTKFEVKVQSADSDMTAGARYYIDIMPGDMLSVFVGMGAEYITFSGDSASGSGYDGHVFAGGELFLMGGISLQVDVGYYYVSITEDSGESVSSTAPGLTMGINLYW